MVTCFDSLRTCLIEDEVEKRERILYECALAVENDTDLKKEMNEWDVTLSDGINEETETVSKKNKSTRVK